MASGDFTLIRGDDAIISWEIKLANGTPIDLTGCTGFLTIKPELTDDLTDSTAILKVTVPSIDDPTSGHIDFPITSADGEENSSYDIEPGNYFYDVQVKTDTDLIYSQGWRKCSVNPDVTRRTT